MIFKYLLIAFFACMMCFESQAQQVDPAVIKKQLEEKGIDEEEVRKRLLAEGYDPTNVDLNDVAQMAEIEAATERIIQEIESENSTVAKIDTLPTSPISQQQIDQNEAIDATINDVAAVEVEPLPKPKVYGQNLYREGGIKFYQKSEYIQPSPSYILGPGDNVSIAIWGNSFANFNQEINSGGYVKFDKFPRIYLSGLTLEDAREVLKSKLRNNYQFTDNTFEVKVSASRNLNVFIGGDVINTGTYNISSLNTAINALAAAGGPSDIGSLRNIQLIHVNGKKQSLDLYKFMQDPSIGQNYYLQDNDYIIVPVASKIVAIEGAVNRSFQYEMLPNEDLKDLIDFAGGLKANALEKNIRITRIEDGKVIIVNVDLTEKGGEGVALLNGDQVEILSIADDVKNAVYVEGAVDNPGSFALTPNMRLSNLIDKTVLKQDAILDIAYLVRLNDDKTTVRYELINVQSILSGNGASDVELNAGDRLIIRAKSEFVSKNKVTIGGAVRNSGVYDLDGDSDLRVSDAIYLSGGLIETATNFAYIIRNPPGQLNPNYISIDLDTALGNIQSNENINLVPGDVLRVYDQSVYYEESFVTIQGAVREPQAFQYDPTLTLKDVILQAGGLKIEAASNRIDIFRIEFEDNNKTRVLVANISIDENLEIVGGNNFELQPFDQIVIRRAPEFELQRAITISGEVKYPGTFFLVDDNTTILDVINRSGGLTEEAFVGGIRLFRSMDDVGFIVVDLDRAMKNPSSTVNVILQEGDRIEIPKKNNLVTISGAVNISNAFVAEVASQNKMNFVYEKGKGVKHYIESAGGFLENADRSKIIVTHPNGEKHKVKRFLFFKNYPEVVPGSLITVDYKKVELNEGESKDEEIDWGKILSNSIAQATAILSLILLIQNVD